PRQLCAQGAESVVEGQAVHRTRLVEPRLDPLLQGIADVGAASGTAFHDEVPEIRRDGAAGHRRTDPVLPGKTRTAPGCAAGERQEAVRRSHTPGTRRTDKTYR